MNSRQKRLVLCILFVISTIATASWVTPMGSVVEVSQGIMETENDLVIDVVIKETDLQISIPEYRDFEVNIPQPNIITETPKLEAPKIESNKVAYLTFDDGPSPVTEDILNILKSRTYAVPG